MTQQPTLFPETVDDVIARWIPVIEAEARAGFAVVRKFINRSVSQRLRFQRERFNNRGSIKERKRIMATSTKKVSECPCIEMKPCESSQIASYGYCEKSRKLAMSFHNKNGVSPVYQYDFTPEQYAALDASESKGSYFGKNIKSLDCVKVIQD